MIVDEVHQAKADVLKELLTKDFAHIPLRWGLTGTIPKAEHEQVSLKACLGEAHLMSSNLSLIRRFKLITPHPVAPEGA